MSISTETAPAVSAPAAAAPGAEQTWLERQCRMLNARAGLVVRHQADAFLPVALWPHQAAAEPMLELVERCFLEGAGLFGELSEPGLFGMAYPVRRAAAVVAKRQRLDGTSARALQWEHCHIALAGG
jgi:hypothetical protein